MWHESNADIVESCYWMASVHFTSCQKQSRGLSTSNSIIRQISAVSMLMDSIIPWLTTRMVIYSVRNGSGPSHPVRVRVQIEPLPHWHFGLSMNLNRQLGYGLMVNSQPIFVGRVDRGSPSRSIQRFDQASCFCSMLIVSCQNRVFNNQGYVFACFEACNIKYFEIDVLPLIDCIVAFQGGQ